MSPSKPWPPMVQVWVWFVGQATWKRMSIREGDLPLIGSPTALITVEGDGFLPTPMPGWRLTRERPGNGGPPLLPLGRPSDG